MIKFAYNQHQALWGYEEWLVSAHESSPSKIVGEEPKTLRDIMPDFPLLIKRICAHDRLSVQVHPNDETAKIVGGEAKTEMWCVLKAGPIFAGFKPGVTAADVKRAVLDGTFEPLLKRFDARSGECYYIPGGLVHAIGEGTSVYEVQQSSNTTFRLYDWGRLDASGNPRQLHVKSALEAMDINLPPPTPSMAVTCNYFDFYQQSGGSVVAEDSPVVVFEPASGDCVLLQLGEEMQTSTQVFVTKVK